MSARAAKAVVTAEPDPVVRAYLAHVDRTLLVKNLSLTPDERFRQLMALQEMAAELRRAGREARMGSANTASAEGPGAEVVATPPGRRRGSR